MAGQNSSPDDEMISGINVTPLVDVVLVLLVIFMITAPVIYQTSINVELPEAKTGEGQSSEKKPLMFTITKDGRVNWAGEFLSWEKLREKLQTIKDRLPQESAIISADQAAAHGTVVELIDTLRQFGLTKFSLNVQAKAN